MKNKKLPDEEEPEFEICDAISAYECTGLIPRAPESKSELDAYDEIINYSPVSANVFNDKKK